MKEVSVRVEAAYAGRTVTAVLHGASALSHSMIRGLVDLGHVTLNGRPVRQAVHRVTPGDVIVARFDPDTRYHERARPPRPTGFRLAMEDDDLLVADKDAGLLTVPTPARPSGALVDLLLEHYRERGVRSPRLWVVHRIDRFVSGLVLFARTEASAAGLIEQFESHRARREYLAICEGIPDPAERRLESRLAESPRSLKMKETRNPAKGLKATCTYRVEERLTGAALVRVVLETGRRNQIRVQFAGIGHPLVGDRVYGNASPLLPRVALHAARLGFTHPRTGQAVSLESPLPPDMRGLLRRLRAAASD